MLRILLVVLGLFGVQYIQAQTQSAGAQIVNVRSYGCAGNGTADDTACIVAAGNAIVAAAANGPVELYFPAGRYMINPMKGMSPYTAGATGAILLDFSMSHANGITVMGEGTASQIALLPYTASAQPGKPYNEQVAVAKGSEFYFFAIRFAGNDEAVLNMAFDGNGQSYGANGCQPLAGSSDPNGCFWFSGVVDQGSATMQLQNLNVSHNTFYNSVTDSETGTGATVSFGIAGWPVEASNASHVRISNNSATGSEGMNCVDGSTDCVIDGNTSDKSFDAPYSCNGGSGGVAEAVQGCVISNNTAGTSNNGSGIDVTATTDATITGNYVSGASNWCIQVDRSGGAYWDGPTSGILPARNITVTGNHCIGNSVWDGWPFNPEIMIGDEYACALASNGSGCVGASWTPGMTALNVTVTRNYCDAKNQWGTCVAVGFGAEGVNISNNTMAGCGTNGQPPRSIWIDGGTSTANVSVTNNTLVSGSSCTGEIYENAALNTFQDSGNNLTTTMGAAGSVSSYAPDVIDSSSTMQTGVRANLTVNDTTKNYYSMPFSGWAPDIGAGGHVREFLGQGASTLNAAQFGFTYAGGAGSQANYLGLGFYNAEDLFRLYPTGAASLSGSFTATASGVYSGVTDTTTSYYSNPFRGYAPIIGSGGHVRAFLGQGAATYNSAQFGFTYAGGSGSAENYLGLGFYNAEDLFRLYPTGNAVLHGGFTASGALQGASVVSTGDATFNGVSSEKMLANCGTITFGAGSGGKSLQCSWVTSSSACTLTPRNQRASVSGAYYTPGTGSVSVFAAMPQAEYSVACSSD